MTEPMMTTPPPAPEAGGRSVWTNLKDVVFAPSDTFEDVGRAPRSLAPLLVMMAITVVTTYLLMPLSVEMQQQGLAARDMPADQREQAAQMIETFKWIGLAIGPVMVALFSAIYAVFWWAFAAVSGAKNASFKVAFPAMIYAGFILSLQAIAQGIVVMTKGAEQVAREGMPTFGLALFLERGDMGRWMWGLISNLNFFTIWHAVVIAIAGMVALKMSKGAATTFAILVWLLNIVWLALQAPAVG